MLNFGDQTRTGAFSVVWSSASEALYIKLLADLCTVVLHVEEPAAEEEAVEQCDDPYNAFLTGSFVPSSHVSCAFPTVNQE